MRCTFCVCLISLIVASTHALEVDASKFGFTFQIPSGWKVLGNPNPIRRPLLAIETDRKAAIAVRVRIDRMLPRANLHYAAPERALAPGAKFKIIETSVFRASSNDVGLCTKSNVTTKDASLPQNS